MTHMYTEAGYSVIKLPNYYCKTVVVKSQALEMVQQGIKDKKYLVWYPFGFILLRNKCTVIYWEL